MGGFVGAERMRPSRSSAPDSPARSPAGLAEAMADSPLGRTARMIRDSPVMRARAATLRGAYGSALDPLPVRRVEAAGADSSPLQRKLKVASSPTEYHTSNAASAAAPPSQAANWALLDKAANAAELYTVKTAAALTELAEGKDQDVLLPSRHLIGELHNASQFPEIKSDWPGVPTMVEGEHTIRETGLQQKGSTAFKAILQSQASADLPLENYHAASLARLIIYLTLWNGFQESPKRANSEHYLLQRAASMVAIFNNYAEVATAVFKSGMDASWFKIWPAYAGEIEKAYGAMFDLLVEAASQETLVCLQRIQTASRNGSTTVPAMTTRELAVVRNWLRAMVEIVGAILTASAKGHPAEANIALEAKAARTHVDANYKTMADSATAHGLTNPTRERFMAEQIGAAPVPSLIKAGSAHVQRLRNAGIAHATFHDDANAFTAALRKKASDL